MAATISDLLEGVCGMLLAGEIASVVGAKGGNYSPQYDKAHTQSVLSICLASLHQ